MSRENSWTRDTGSPSREFSWWDRQFDEDENRSREFGRAISRELHDDIAHGIAAAVARMELGTHYLDRGDLAAARVKWTEAREIARRTLVLTKKLAVAARAFFAGNVPATGEAADNQLRPPREELYLILREAVKNALDHSGADNITIRLSVGTENLTATVEDDGGGIPDDQVDSVASLGLRSILERAELLGGTAALRSAPARGTRLEVTLPVPTGRNPAT